DVLVSAAAAHMNRDGAGRDCRGHLPSETGEGDRGEHRELDDFHTLGVALTSIHRGASLIASVVKGAQILSLGAGVPPPDCVRLVLQDGRWVALGGGDPAIESGGRG